MLLGEASDYVVKSAVSQSNEAIKQDPAQRPMCSCTLQGLSSLRRLDLRSNQLRRLEVLAPCQGLGMLGDFDVADNPLEAGQNIRLYIISLLPQVRPCGHEGKHYRCQGLIT